MSRMRPEEPLAVRIEAENEWVWCGTRRLELMPRAFAVLRHLVEHRGRLVTKEELHSRSSQGARRPFRSSPVHPDRASTGLPLHRSRGAILGACRAGSSARAA